jgi:hypothetical protein
MRIEHEELTEGLVSSLFSSSESFGFPNSKKFEADTQIGLVPP